jgi:glycolate oxidase FAD binding subunit
MRGSRRAAPPGAALITCAMPQRDAFNLADEIGALVGVERVRLPRERETRAAKIIIEPESTYEITEIIRKCETDGITLAPMGSGRTLAEIRHGPVDAGVSLARMNRIVAFEPDDMTVVAEAGLTLGVLNRQMAVHGQCLPADPPMPDLTTLGALVATARSGPIRLGEGTLRDLLIGIRFVGHDGRLVHGGGRVVKNVAGYDLMKVMTGSFGTLGIITETAFKVRPIRKNYTLAIVACDRVEDAFEVARNAEQAAPLIHVEVLSQGLGALFARPAQAVVLAGFGGNRTEVEHQRARICDALGPHTEIMKADEATGAYERLRDLDFSDATIVAQMAVMPAELARCLSGCGAHFRAHAASGVAQIFLADAHSGDEIQSAVARWRGIAHSARGNLRVLAARADLRAGLKMFDDPPEPGLKLMRRLKTAFDPHGIFNPGCFVGGL